MTKNKFLPIDKIMFISIIIIFAIIIIKLALDNLIMTAGIYLICLFIYGGYMSIIFKLDKIIEIFKEKGDEQ